MKSLWSNGVYALTSVPYFLPISVITDGFWSICSSRDAIAPTCLQLRPNSCRMAFRMSILNIALSVVKSTTFPTLFNVCDFNTTMI